MNVNTLQDKDNSKTFHSIGEIRPVKDRCTLYFNFKSHQATAVYDKHGNLVCFFAKQTLLGHGPVRHNVGDKQSVLANKNPNVFKASSNKFYYYFFSPFYHGESPIASIGPQEIKAGRKALAVYTFKRKYDDQLAAVSRGYFGERMYTHGFVTVNKRTNEFEYYRFPQQQSEELDLAVPFLVGSIKELDISQCLESLNLCANICCGNEIVEFRNAGKAGERSIVIDGLSKSMKLIGGTDMIEAICLWCACNILLGHRITAG